jgi:hypothetical protein
MTRRPPGTWAFMPKQCIEPGCGRRLHYPRLERYLTNPPPGLCKRCSNRRRALSAEHRAKMAEAMRRRWQEPDYRDRQLIINKANALIRSRRVRPLTFEEKLILVAGGRAQIVEMPR